MDIEEGRVPYRLFLQAVAYSSARAKTQPFLQENVNNRIVQNLEKKKQLERVKKMPTPRGEGGIAKLVK